MVKISKVIRGDSHTINLLVKRGQTPVDLTGYTVFFTVSASDNPASDTTAIIKKTIGIASAPDGVVSIPLVPEDTFGVAPGNYYYDVQLKSVGGDIISIPQDIFNLVADITRRTTA